MSEKLTLTLEEEVIQAAKKYAKTRNRSVSDLVEQYFRFLTEGGMVDPSAISPTVRSLMGSFKAPADFDYKKILEEEKLRKYE